jgi:SecD/SecF fusion protein
MDTRLKWRIILILTVISVSCFYLAPSIFKLPSWWESTFPSKKISLGLDLQGGMHLLLEVESEKALSNTVDRIVSDLKDILLKERIPFRQVDRVETDKLLVELLDPAYKEDFGELLEERLPNLEKLTFDEEEGIVAYTLGLTSENKEYLKRLAVDQGLETIRNRIDEFGVSEPTVQKQSGDRILIQLPGIKDPKRAIDLIAKTALLEFKIVNDDYDVTTAVKENKPPPGCEILYSKREDKKTGEITKKPFLLKKRTMLTGEHLINARVNFDQFNMPYVGIAFDSSGAKRFERVTGENIKKRMAIILDNNVYSAPVIQDKISGGRAQITGNFTMDEARDLAIVLRAGSLPAPVRILEQRTVGPSLGQDSINQGVKSILIGGAVVVVFMMIYYLLSGAIANAALCLNILIILSALAAFKATLTLPGIAGILLTIGMAVDANVLIFERTREELRTGKTPRAAIEGGYAKALVTILDANITTLIAALFLFQFGTGPIKGFAVTLTIGLTAKIMELIKPDSNINFVGNIKGALIFSLILIAIGLGSLTIKGGPRYGIDFEGGTLVQIKFFNKVDISEVRVTLSDLDIEGLSVQEFGEKEANEYLITMKKTTGELEGLSDKIKTALMNRFSAESLDIRRVEMVGPKVGKDLRRKGMSAVIFSLIGMLIYIWWRFELRFGVGAIICLLHDVTITLGALSITNKPIDLPIIAALLTVVGYSVNDTIIISDRIRENLKKMIRERLKEIVNKSVNQTLSRTCITAGTTLMVVIALFFLGGEVIHDFAFTLLVGICIGTYSSIFIASPLLIVWERFFPKKKKR